MKVLIALCLVGCGGAAPLSERGPELSRWTYRFTVDAELERLRATICFDGPAPYAITPIDPAGRRYLRSARGPDGEPLVRYGGGLITDGLPRDACVEYVVDLEEAARQRGGIQGAYRIGTDLVASTGVWLWAPAHRSESVAARATFDLPEGIRVSPLWLRGDDDFYQLDERAFRFIAYAAFGRFQRREVRVPGGCLNISVLGNGVEMGPDALARSIARSASATSMLLGRFPRTETGLLAVPTPFSLSSPFGIIGRGTMPTVAILVGERADEERLSRAWVPVHEFSHLATPFIDREDAWLSEGIATYYQEVLRARGGLTSSDEAWENLADGFARGARDGTGRNLADESRAMIETAAFRRVYWAGAAIALMADVEMRVRSRGGRSLDDAILALYDCCAEAIAPMSAEEALERMERGRPPVIRPIAERWLGSREFPDLSRAYSALGIERVGGRLFFGGGARASALREAIMAPREDLAPVPERCGRW